MKTLSLRELVRIDAELTASLVDTPTTVTHKIQASGSGLTEFQFLLRVMLQFRRKECVDAILELHTSHASR